VSLVVIFIAVFLAIFAPVIAPDGTPNANEQILELANKNPGYSAKMLMLRKNRLEAPSNFLQRIARGQENAYRLIPITDYRIDGAQIVASTYKGDHIPPME